MKPIVGVLLFTLSMLAQAVPLKVAFVYVSPVGDAGWSHSHDLGRQYLESKYGDKIQTHYVESVPEGRPARAVLAQLAKENDIIFSTSWGYMVPASRIAQEYPEVKFEHATGLRRGDNLSTYATRAYQARYLSGMVAAAMSKTGQVGYVAAHPIAEVIRGLNAFTLGAQSIRRDIKVNVQWTNAWYAPAKSRQLSHKLIDEGADVLAHHVDTPTPIQVAEERGVFAIGYHTDMSEFGPNSHLASVVHNWGKIYEQRVLALADDQWHAEDLWPGLKQNTSDIVALDDQLPEWLKAKVVATKQQIQRGDIAVFTGPVKNHRGRVRVKTGKKLDDDELQRMNWYVEGVYGDLKFF